MIPDMEVSLILDGTRRILRRIDPLVFLTDLRMRLLESDRSRIGSRLVDSSRLVTRPPGSSLGELPTVKQLLLFSLLRVILSTASDLESSVSVFLRGVYSSEYLSPVECLSSEFLPVVVGLSSEFLPVVIDLISELLAPV